ncbi:MAG: hypothetical protein NC209_05845 [Alistipes sp.]|nr:hypothetical protein [Alistipes senegalensis]MCM1250646.1 hypothetical protein [Alistipes sp.]
MIKKLIGMLFAAATLGVIVFAILGRDRYRSLLAQEGALAPRSADSRPAQEPEAEVVPFDGAADADAGTSSGITSPDEYFEDDDELPSDLFQEDATL